MKAVGLRFAECFVEQEVLTGIVISLSVLFSQRKADAALVNRITHPTDIPVQPYYERLEKLK